MKIAIVILNWNGRNFLEKFLPSVIENSANQDAEIIIADNGSSDDSILFLKNKYPKIQIIVFEKNYGFAEGYNKALFQIDAKYFVLLNSDVEVTPNWISPIIEQLDNNENIAACQPKILSFADKQKFEYAGAAGGFIDKLGYPFCRGRIISQVEIDSKQYNDIKEIFWATGACLFVRADIYKKQGGLDADFFAHMEEIDLCWRLKNKGYQIFYNSNSTVYHVGGGTLPNNNPFKLFLNFRNNLIILYKNLPASKLFFTIFTRMILDGMSGFIYLITFKFSYFFAVIKAHFAFYKSIGKYKNFRKENQILNNSINNEIYPKSIVYDFFIRKKKDFKSLNFNN